MASSADTTKEHFCFIIHAALPYCYDLNTILALPSGFRYRNRFDTPWVDPNLRPVVPEMVNHDVLLVLRDQERNELLPVRWAVVRWAEQIGPIYLFEYTLGDIVRYPRDKAERAGQISRFTATFTRFHPELPGQAGTSLSTPSVFRSVVGREFPRASGEDLTEWGNTTYAVAGASIFHQVEFLKVMGLYDLAGRSCPVIDEGFLVKPNTVYQLRVFQTIPDPGETTDLRPHDIDLETFSDHIVQLRGKQRAVGKYDMLNFVLKTRQLPPRERSAIQIPHKPHHYQGEYAPGSLYLPLATAGRPAVIRLAWVLATVATLVLMFRPQLVPLDKDTVRNVATVLFVLLITGWTNTAASLIPKLPWSRQ